MARMARREASTGCLWCMFVGAAVLAGHSDVSHQAAAQETSGKTLMVTSFGTTDTRAPPEIFQINIDGSGRKPLLPKKTGPCHPPLSPDHNPIVLVGRTHTSPH